MSRPLGRLEAALVAVGVGCVILGGLVAAVTGPLGLEHGSWLAAYLVLVGGVAQVAFGLAPTLLNAPATSPRLGWSMLSAWNAGNVLVVAGTLAALPLVVDGGSALLIVGLATALYAARRSPRRTGRERAGLLVGWAYRALLLVLLVSIPIGVVLAHVRAGN